MIEVRQAMAALAGPRPVFHSEADFQHALAWQIHDLHPGAVVRLETRPIPAEALFVDIVVSPAGVRTAIECKYLVRRFEKDVEGEAFALRDQSAHDVRRYDCLKDVQRIEHLIETGVVDDGVVVVLSNDGSYWRPATRPGTKDAAFRINEGRTITGSLSWGPGTSAGTMRNREEPVNLSGRYRCQWADFSKLGDDRAGQFRYLAVPVPPAH